jgi:GT2 family glycosyltransferase
VSARQQIVVLGMMTKMPVAGVVWQTLHYLVGLERLGYETYYVEAHARTPSMLMEHADDDSSGRAAAFIAGTLERFGFGDRWAFHALHDDGRCYGLSATRLKQLYRSAALIINLHGGTEPRAEHIATDRLVYLETDPVEVEIQLAQGRQTTIDYLQPHCAYFTFGENYGRPDCLLPVSPLFNFQATRQPVVLDFWQERTSTRGERYTTIGNWRQEWRDVEFGGEKYSWSKHHEFSKFLDLPSRVEAEFELAVGGYGPDDRRLLEQHGWRVREAQPLSLNIDIYRHYIAGSRGEFTVAKDQNIRLRTGWFSDRAATYLAAGRPVINQDTGFGNNLPVGEGLFAFSTLDDIVVAVEAIEADYERHSRAASEIAREYFDSGRVLGRLLEQVGMPRIAPGLVIALSSRRPTTLPEETERAALEAPLPVSVVAPTGAPADVSAVVVTHNGLVFTRLCLESVLASRSIPNLEVIVVDNGSTDGTHDYLHRLAERDSRFCLINNGRNLGFAAAVNRGLAAARGEVLVVLNNDTIVPPSALSILRRRLDDHSVGLVGPVSNEASTEAEIDETYRTYGELLAAAQERVSAHFEEQFDVPVLTMFCIAFRRDFYDRVGPLDERFEIGLFEDDDYSVRARKAGYRVVCAEDVLVHHFGEASLGGLVPSGEHASLFSANRRRFEEKWGLPWRPHGRRQAEDYRDTIERIRETVRESVPAGARVLVVSKGDDDLLQFDGRPGAHFPQVAGGAYAGHHPADSLEAITDLEDQLSGGAEFLVIPRTSLWWLDHYVDFRAYLERGGAVVRTEECVIYRLRSGATTTPDRSAIK